ncbi:chromosome-associated kinesin KIF4A-like [Homarus americanus]|uniref:chromosome-associated kinesin KIF4A-like n=1 Tax=Homarus americanus TaxID=6706 RepID=UPI001C47CCC2|nr:chromosome-associated kinesin KIF4A-like [Homarus americanus]XP_042221302.1 chromosome-associated kinesin KIF4A-like [Homarus americanus]
MGSDDGSSSKVIPVKVAVRVRPLNGRETREGCQECLDVTNGSPQVVVRGTEKAFTFDFAYSNDCSQAYIYETAVKNVVTNLFKGYNVTVVAYGQTGSGKTHTMGTAYTEGEIPHNEAGIIPRAVRDIFDGVGNQTECEFMVKVSFIELYKENLFDLLSTKNRDECSVDIREDPRGGIKIVGLSEIPVATLDETMKCLEQGALNRATGATAMNAHSSRSHAIFSLHIQQRNKKEGESITCSKFHMVDLAGSERAKKTGATGERFKEGVNINKGLLALGNVISALCEEGGRGHIPYRDSKLTRLLQDSLGGNSHTVMIACVSPADSNLEETLSTLRYADRARKIKNKPIVNRDPQAAELARLRQQVQQLQVQLLSSNSHSGGIRVASADEINALLDQNRLLQDENEKLARALHTALDENTSMAEKALLAEMSQDRLKMKLEELRAQTGNTVEVLNKTFDVTCNPKYEDQINLVKELQSKIIELQGEQRKGEKAIMDHELSRHNISTNTLMISSDETTSSTFITQDVKCGENTTESVDELSKQFGTEYTLRQAKLNEELQDLNKALAMKEELMSKMTVNDTHFLAMKATYEKEKKDLETHIDLLSKEKDELTQQLKVVSHSSAGNKVSEQRRKRVQELETQITDLKKKQKEQAKLLRLKDQSEQKVNKLNSEIQSMKATRVKLIRQMKEDNEKFRVWKAQKDREVAKLKEADRRKEYQIVKMERLHSKQQNVLRRKMEEAVAINKRLKDAMALQKAGAEKRAASRDPGGAGNRIRSWLEGELEVVSVKKQAKQSLKNLVEDRKTISDQINSTKAQMKKGDLSPEMLSEFWKKIGDLDNDLQLRSAQINDLQTKIVDGDEDASSKKRFDSIQSMIEAKCALHLLFDVATSNHVNTAAREADLKDLQSQYDEVANTLEEMEAELKTLKENHQAELTRTGRQHEEKVLFLLGHMPKVEHEVVENEDAHSIALRERLQFQEDEIARLSTLHEELEAKREECETLKKELANAKVAGSSQVVYNPTVANNDRRRTYVKTKPTKKVELVEEPLFESEEDSDGGDTKDDPDWRKTPLFRRIRQLTHNVRSFEDANEENEEEILGKKDKKNATKRDSDGEVKCGCKGDCSKKICACRKNSNACGLKCKCNVIKCKNRSTPDSSISDVSKGDTLLNSTFDITALPLQESNINKRPRLQVTSSLLDTSSHSESDSPDFLPKFKIDYSESPSLF